MPAIDYAGQNAMQIFPGYVHEIELRKDSDWAFYRDFLYPRAIARQYRENRRLLEELKESGDILSAERPIYHFAAFKSDGERKTFIDDVLKHGFSLADNGLGTSDYTDRPYSVEIQRTDTTQLERIDEVTTQIISLARSHDGKYDGWETSVVLRISKKF
jgi:regulator of RNase E activity RraB